MTTTPSIPPTQRSSINNPQEEPVSVWNDIPIMPQAIKAHESDEEDAYVFTIDATQQEVRDYYYEQLLNLGWIIISAVPIGEDADIILYEDKDGIRLFIFISTEGELLSVSLQYPYRGLRLPQ